MSKIKSNLHNISLLLLCILAIIFVVHFSPYDNKKGENGVLDLSMYSETNFPMISIGDSFTLVPTNIPYTAHYTLSVTCPEALKTVSIKIPAIYGTYRLYLNGNIISSYKHTNDGSNSFPSPDIIMHNCESNILTFDLFIPSGTSLNSPYSNPSINYDFFIGNPVKISSYQNAADLLDFALFLIFIFYFIYQIMEYCLKQYEKTHIYMALLSLSIALEIIISSQNIIIYFFPSITIHVGIKLIIVAYTIRNISIMLMSKKYFKNEKYINIYFVSFTIIVSISLASIFLPNSLNPYILLLHQAFNTLIILGSLLNALVRTSPQSPRHQYTLITAYFTLLLGSILSDLYSLGLTKFFSLQPFCFILFIIFITVWMNSVYYSSLDNIRSISADMKQKIFEMQENRSTYISTHIRPTYIYGTLEEITKAVDNDQDKVDSLIQALSKYLRQTLDFDTNKISKKSSVTLSVDDLNNTSNTYTIEDELEFCENYMIIVNAKYPNYKMYIVKDDIALNTPIPKFSIQALIENSVLHAFGGVIKPRITVYISVIEDNVRISVVDNGSGMNKKNIQKNIDNPSMFSTIGLYHVDKILKTEFNSGLEVESVNNKYTSVSFTVPFNGPATYTSDTSQE